MFLNKQCHCLKHDQEKVCAWQPNSIYAFCLRSSVHLCWCGFFQYVYPDSLRMFENSCVGVASLCFCYWISDVLWNPAGQADFTSHVADVRMGVSNCGCLIGQFNRNC